MVRKLPKTISEKQFFELIKNVKDKRYKLIYTLGFYEGLRLSEICGLREEVSACCKAPLKISKKQKRVYRECSKCLKFVGLKDIRRSTSKWKIEPLKPSQFDRQRGFLRIFGKGSKSSDIPIMPPVEKALRTGIRLLPINISARQVERAINRDSEEILGKDNKLHFHALRHSCAVFWLHQRKMDIRYIQMLLRHSRMDTTSLYLTINPTQMQEAFNKAWGD